jgi:hypothetical protein
VEVLPGLHCFGIVEGLPFVLATAATAVAVLAGLVQKIRERQATARRL